MQLLFAFVERTGSVLLGITSWKPRTILTRGAEVGCLGRVLKAYPLYCGGMSFLWILIMHHIVDICILDLVTFACMLTTVELLRVSVCKYIYIVLLFLFARHIHIAP